MKENEERGGGPRQGKEEQDTGLSVLNIVVKTYCSIYVVLISAHVNFLVQVPFLTQLKLFIKPNILYKSI